MSDNWTMTDSVRTINAWGEPTITIHRGPEIWPACSFDLAGNRWWFEARNSPGPRKHLIRCSGEYAESVADTIWDERVLIRDHAAMARWACGALINIAWDASLVRLLPDHYSDEWLVKRINALLIHWQRPRINVSSNANRQKGA